MLNKSFFKGRAKSPNHISSHAKLGLESLEARWNPSGTQLAGDLVQGNLYGDQSEVLVLPLVATNGKPTSIQLIDTGDTGMAGQAVNTFVPFPGYQGEVTVAVGDFLNKGYQQLIVSAAGKVQAHVKIFDLYQTYINNTNSSGSTSSTFANPVTIQSFLAFNKAFQGGASVAAGDFNADGKDDLAVGAGPGASPHVRVFLNGNPNAQIASFYAFGDKRFHGGVDLAAGHLHETPNADLIVGAGSGGGSRVVSYAGNTILAQPNNPSTNTSYYAFGNGQTNTALKVQLIESIVTPEAAPVTGLDANNLTGLFTPTNNAPLIVGSIAAYNHAKGDGLINLYSPVPGSPSSLNVQIPNPVTGSNEPFRVHMAPVGYMYDHAVGSITGNYTVPMALVADPSSSSVSLYPLTQSSNSTSTKAQLVQPVTNIYGTSQNPNQYTLSAFPFGTSLITNLPNPVKVLASNLNNTGSQAPAGGTSGTLPSRQVAYQSPFPLSFTNSLDSLFGDFSKLPWNNPTNQTNQDFSTWYTTNPTEVSWGPGMQGPPPSDASFPLPSQINSQTQQTFSTFVQERMIATGLQIMNQGYYYQHHHMPAWYQPQIGQSLSQIIEGYPSYSLTPAGMQTPGLDCSDFTNFITDFGLGAPIPTGVATQGTTNPSGPNIGQTNWPVVNASTQNQYGTLQGTSNIYINNDPNQLVLNSQNLQNYYTANGQQATYQMLNATLEPGDLLYYGGGESTSGAVHVTMWVGADVPNTIVPIIMDSHGSGVQVGVDANGNPAGVVAPSGPQMRPWFVPPTQQAATADTQNYYYFSNFSHVIRPTLTVNGVTPT